MIFAFFQSFDGVTGLATQHGGVVEQAKPVPARVEDRFSFGPVHPPYGVILRSRNPVPRDDDLASV